MPVGLLTLELHIAEAQSLKDKRQVLRSLKDRAVNKWNVSVAEVDRQDMWQEAVIACVLISDDHGYTQKALQQVVGFTEKCWPDLDLLEHHIELI